MPKTVASLFTGFDGVGCGAKAAGLELAWGVEMEPALAEVANANLGGHVKVANILDCDPMHFERADVLHASPVCTEFSVAKTGGKESALDIACAQKTAEFVTVLQPEIFTLENVQGYKKSRSWAIIEQALYKAGYWLNVEICNFANLGVPQTRKRMIVRAIRGGMVPYLPPSVPWVGWLAAIEDILDTLPESQFAPWQMARLPDELKATILVDNQRCGDKRDKMNLANASSPSFTLTVSNGSKLKAFIVECKDVIRDATVRNVDEPVFTISSSMASRESHMRAFTGHRVVAITPRALARFQSFPDSYMLPESRTLAAKGIGNAVSPLAYQRILQGLMGG